MNAEELKSLRDELGRTFEQFKGALDQRDTEVKELGTARTETKSRIDAISARLDEIETKLNRPGAIVPAGKGAEQLAPAMAAFEKYLRFGTKGNAAIERMTDEEKAAWKAVSQKSLTEGTDSQGGYFVPEDFRLDIIKKIPNFARIGSLVTRQTTSRDILRYPQLAGGDDIKTSGVTVTWEDENDTVTETDFSLGSVAVPVKKMRALIRVSNDLLEDSAVDVIGLITTLLAEAFAVEEDRVFTKGEGGKQPLGFMTEVAGVQAITAINSGAATDVTIDGLLDLIYGLPEQYAEGASLMVKRSTVAALRKLKDSNGQYLWQPSVQAGQPATVLGYALRTNEHMPTIAAGADAGIFGDLRRLYLVADRVGMSVKRLDEKYAETDEVGFIARRRVGGRVLAPWAARKLRIAA